MVERHLRSANYDCVVVGAEACACHPEVLNYSKSSSTRIRRIAPGTAIAFNTRPDDSADAAARWVAAGSKAV